VRCLGGGSYWYAFPFLLVMSAVLWFFGLVSPETTGLWNTIYDEAPETYATLQGLFSPAG